MSLFSSKHVRALVFLIILPFWVWSQEKDINRQEQLWLGYINQTRLSKHSGLWLDLHFRSTENFVQQKLLSVFRVGYMYHLASARITAGYAKFTRFADEGSHQIEHRGWQQLEWNDARPKLTLTNRIRLEERFIALQGQENQAKEYSFNYRARYSLSMTIPLKINTEKRFPAVVVSNEILLNFGKQVRINYFDQNRIFVGMAYPVAPSVTAQLGYMHIFQQLPVESTFSSINTIRFFVFHNLSLYRKD